MADRHPAAPAVGVGLAAHLVEVHPRRVEVEIQMKVDVEIEAVRDGEDARSLRRRIGVGVGAAADDVGPLLAGGDQQFLGSGIVGQAFLRENAESRGRRPGVIALEGAYGVKPLSPTRGSASTWVRMRVVPWMMAFSRVRCARAWMSASVKVRLAAATVSIASSSVPRSQLQRSRMQDFRILACHWRSRLGKGQCHHRLGEKAVAVVMPAGPLGVSQQIYTAQRMMGMVHAAMFDAVNSIERRYEPYLVQLPADPATSKEAAAAAAAATILATINEKTAREVTVTLATYLASIPDDGTRKRMASGSARRLLPSVRSPGK